MSSRLTKPPRAFHHGNLAAAVLRVTVDIVATEGVDAVTLRKVAQRTGVTPMAAYNHFANKEQLLEAVALEGFEALRRAMLPIVEGGGTALDRWESVGVGYVRFAVE